MQIRRTLAVGAMSAIAFAGFVGAPANADSHLSCETVEASLTAAAEAREEKKDAFTQYKNTPWGKLVKAERAEARTEVRSSERKIKVLVRDAKTEKGAARKELVKKIKAEHRDVARAERELSSKRALRASIKQHRESLKAEWVEAEQELREVRRFKEDCEAAETETETEPESGETEPETGDETSGEGDLA